MSTSTPGRFGRFGGQFVPETLMPGLLSLEAAHLAALEDPEFQSELTGLLRDYAGRPTPLYRAERLEEVLGGTMQIWLKREDLLHTGAHKMNNCLGQVLLARRMGKTRVIAETGAGQHGVATAAACARFGIGCTVYMGEVDMERQMPNVQRMRLMGAEIRPVGSGSRTLKDATSEAIRDWVSHVDDTHYIIGSVVGPHPYPKLVADFQYVIGQEARKQILSQSGGLPTHAVACVGGGSNAMGLFGAFLDDSAVRLVAVEAGGSDQGHASSLGLGQPGVLHGAMSLLLQDDEGQVAPVHSISAGLDYPGVGPQLSHLKDSGRLVAASVSDDEAVAALRRLSRCEGILPALESSHALAHLERLARDSAVQVALVNLSGRGDKDLAALDLEVC